MKSAVALALAFLSTFAVASHGTLRHHRRQCSDGGHIVGSNPGIPNQNGWFQNSTGLASFTVYSGCQNPSCGGQIASGYTAAVNTRSFGATSDFGDICGRCFKITGTSDPYSPAYTGPFNQPIVVKVNDLCPISGNAQWCSQTASNPLNQFGMPMHFDLCQDSGASEAFFPAGRGALLGNFEEVSCDDANDKWKGSECPTSLWNNWCMGNNSTPLWPKKGCGNLGNGP